MEETAEQLPKSSNQGGNILESAPEYSNLLRKPGFLSGILNSSIVLPANEPIHLETCKCAINKGLFNIILLILITIGRSCECICKLFN